MQPHLHTSAADFLVFAAFFIILKLAFTLIQTRWPDAAVSKALAVLG